MPTASAAAAGSLTAMEKAAAQSAMSSERRGRNAFMSGHSVRAPARAATTNPDRRRLFRPTRQLREQPLHLRDRRRVRGLFGEVLQLVRIVRAIKEHGALAAFVPFGVAP